MIKKKIALFYPWIKSKGGAESVLLEILKNKDYDIDLYTWVYDAKNSFEEFKQYNIKVISPKIAEKLSRTYILRSLFLPLSLFSKIDLENYDTFLIYTSGLGEFITFRNYKPGKTYAYVNTPLRANCNEIKKWNLKYRYKSFLSKSFYLLAANIYGLLEKIAWKRINKAIFISNLGLERAKEKNLLKNKKSGVVYVPINLDRFKKLKPKKGNYFLYVSRFSVDKRQDVLIKTWSKFVEKHPKYKLVLAGGMENKKYFEKIKLLAKKTKNIEIKTNVKNKELLKLYQNCLAGIFVPFMEDFGIVPFEILSTGKPLIVVNTGGYVNLIKKHSQVLWVKEKYDSKLMEDEIYKSLEKFLNLKFSYKKINFKDLSLINFKKNLDKVILK
jgi:glycosyltransferase involved in cell wall biosynthesis